MSISPMRTYRVIRIIVVLAVFGAAGYLLRGYITDDTFIHLRFVENLLERGEFSFNPGDKAYGATSPLWVFGLALLVISVALVLRGAGSLSLDRQLQTLLAK